MKYGDLIVEQMTVVLVDEPRIREAQNIVTSCEKCDKSAVIPFDYLLDALIGKGPATEYLMHRFPACPHCKALVNEKTLVSV